MVAGPDLEAAVAEEKDQHHAGNEAADVRQERDAGLRSGRRSARSATGIRTRTPAPSRRNLVHPENAEGDEHVHAGVGEQQQIRAEQPGIAPLAPIIGTSGGGIGQAWAKAAATPHSR